MIQLEVPHINVLSKMDLFDKQQRRAINRCGLGHDDMGQWRTRA